MANIKIQDLSSVTGVDLFSDPESFIQDLSDRELGLQGGWRELFTALRFGNVVWD